MLGFVLVCTACVSPSTTSAVPAAVPTAKADSGVPEPARAPEAAKPVDPIAPPTYGPVLRHGKKPQPKVRAGKGGFAPTAPATYPDGVSIKVDRIKHGVEKGQGPGTFPGRANTVLSITLTNRSTRPIDVNQVVVTTMYGAPARIAAPVYEVAGVRDFAGSVQPGGSATATYAFAIPTKQAKKVVTIVDFDGVHVPAELAGATQ